MKFEIGKSYTFKNFSTEEILTLQKGDDMATETRTWTNGTWSFTIENEDQLAELEDAQIEADVPTFHFEEGVLSVFNNTASWSLGDCDSEWTVDLSADSEYDDSELEEELNWNSGISYLEEEGWEEVDSLFGATEIIFEGED